MEDCSFHSQLLSVMEVLAKAAVAEINRRVDDSCAVLRLEASRSRRDIELLKRKCEVMEAELRRSRARARRKDRVPPVVRELLSKDTLGSDWDTHTEAEAQHQRQQCDTDAEHVLIKEECAEEDKLIPEAEQSPRFEASQLAPTDGFADPGSLVSPADGYDTFPEQQLNRTQDEAAVKHEREEGPDENLAPLDPAHGFVSEEGDGQPWSSSLCRDAVDPSFSYADEQFEPIPAVFPSQSGLHLDDVAPRVHSVGKSLSVVVSAARVRRRARTFGCRRPQPDEGHNALSPINTMDQCSIPQQSQIQYRDSAPHARNPSEDLSPPHPAASSFCGHSRGSFGLSRRMRTPWRSGIGEKRFSCTYCDKSFMRFSQLKEHLRSHTGEKPFSCLQCGRSFTKQCNLIRHAVVHSGEKPYECSLCGKCFTQRSSLKSHQKTAH